MYIRVELTRDAKKDLEKAPLQIVLKLQAWSDLVNRVGIYEARKISGYHDEPLKGKRKGQRSIRLNKAYRAIYMETKDNKIHLISIVEVNKHEY
ncbi:MAG TPA: type II toxin-antitoxin system mRNA interferase toxin, RelE/StbE family [Gammaproteobacteria bacterium]|nr:type II toxin-antitoxin system mRNA interferase toxin, RelE/StbE family [Gammaproteobacteria bacterium]